VQEQEQVQVQVLVKVVEAVVRGRQVEGRGRGGGWTPRSRPPYSRWGPGNWAGKVRGPCCNMGIAIIHYVGGMPSLSHSVLSGWLPRAGGGGGAMVLDTVGVPAFAVDLPTMPLPPPPLPHAGTASSPRLHSNHAPVSVMCHGPGGGIGPYASAQRGPTFVGLVS
jgi:hypothetical protein